MSERDIKLLLTKPNQIKGQSGQVSLALILNVFVKLRIHHYDVFVV